MNKELNDWRYIVHSMHLVSESLDDLAALAKIGENAERVTTRLAEHSLTLLGLAQDLDRFMKADTR